MMLGRADIVKAAGAVVAVLLQVIVAPTIALYGSFPNIPLVYVLAVSIACPSEVGPLMPFLLGLACDLLGSGPVGGMAFLFVLASVASSRLFLVLENSTLFMPFAIMFAGMLAVETLYGILLLALGLPVGFGDAFLHRIAPCALYDCVVGIVVYPIMMLALAGGTKEPQPRTPKLR